MKFAKNEHGAIIKALFFIVGMIIFANILSVVSIDFLVKISISPHYFSVWKQIRAQNWISYLSQIGPFPIVNLIVFIYFLPLIREIRRQTPPNKYSEKTKKVLLMSPIVLSLLGVLGWVLGSIIFMGLAPFEGIYPPLGLIIEQLLLNCALSGITFVITYYSTEYILREFIMPLIFSDGKIKNTEFLFKMNVQSKLFIFLFSAVMLPMIIFYRVMMSLNNNGVNLFKEDLTMQINLFCIGVLIISTLITFLKSYSIQKPIHQMSLAAQRIENGDLNIQLPVTGTDEIGELGQSMNRMAEGLRERQKIKDTFGRMVDPKVRDHLMQGSVQLGGELHEVSLIFSDLQDFTSLSEKMQPAEVVRFLNRYFEAMTAVVLEEQGVVNKYIGDAIMVVFGVPNEMAGHADAAVRCAIKMLEAQKKLNSELLAEGLPQVYTRIGIHSGEVLAGNIGTTSRMEYTLIGDNVNTAARLEQLGKKLERAVLISGETFKLMQFNKNLLKPLGKQILRGRQDEVDVFTLDGV